MAMMVKDPSIDEFVDLITSPKTNKIYKDPIILDTGEVEELEEYLQTKQKNSYSTIIRLKTFINTFLSEFPEYKSKQYVTDSKIKISHTLNKQLIDSIIQSGKLQQLQLYTQFELSLFTYDQLSYILNKADDVTLIHFFDNINGDIHELVESRNWRMINYVCNVCSKSNKITIVKYFIEKYGGMEYCCDDDKWYPLHQIINFSSDMGTMKLAIDKHLEVGLDLYIENVDGRSVLEYIFEKSPLDIIIYALGKIDKTNNKFKEHVAILYESLNTNTKVSDNEKENLTIQLFSNV